MTRHVASMLVVLCALCAIPVAANAQIVSPPQHRLELAVGIGFLGGASLGDANADLRSATAGPYRLFSTSTQMAGASALDLRAGFDITRRFGVEAHLLFGHPEVRTTISNDAETSGEITAVERLDHYLIDGGLVIRLDELAVKGIQPFATAGLGYLRQLHEGLTVIEDGRVYYVGIGARHWLFIRPGGWFRALGVRGDARFNVLNDGITVNEETRRQPSVSASLFIVF